MQEKKRNRRNTAMMLDLLHILVGVLVVICTVLVFLNPETNQILFPVIFSLAAFLSGVNGWFRLKESKYEKKKRLGGIAQCLLAFVLLAAGVASAVSIWR